MKQKIMARKMMIVRKKRPEDPFVVVFIGIVCILVLLFLVVWWAKVYEQEQAWQKQFSLYLACTWHELAAELAAELATEIAANGISIK